MTNWMLAFDYAAIFILLLILGWYLVEKRIPINTHGTFLLFITVCFVSTGLEIACGQLRMLYDVSGSAFYWVCMSVQSIAVNMVYIIFTCYIIQFLNIKLKKLSHVRNIIRICTLVDLVVLASNPFTRWVNEFSEVGFDPQPGSIVPITIMFIMALTSLVALIKAGKDTPFIKKVIMLMNVICAVVASAIQFEQGILILNFVLATNCLTLYYYLQNPGAVTDAVTKQFNRQFMGAVVTSRYDDNKSFGVVVIAMDDFKFINKTYGVENGDNLLLQVGTFLDSISDSSGIVFRFGSDQFCVLMDRYQNKMDEFAAQIHDRFKHPWYSDNSVGIMMSASICLIECPRDAADYGNLIEVIDYSMSMAKKLNKGMISQSVDLDLDRIQRDKAIEKAVRQALDRDELMVYYQPIFSVNKGAYNSAEALVRLKDAELGWISPEDFIPIAEKNGMIIEMGELILEKVCRFIRDFNLAQTTVEYIEVNISPVQLMQVNFAERVAAIMNKYDVKPEQLNMEITETATMSSSDIVNDNIGRLVDVGINFSLDDYGSGYANIDYINHMPFSLIKLDKYIIWDAFKNNKAGITLEYTIGMLNALQLHIVAEGVETAEMRDHLVNIGCHYMQGWYYSKAVADVEFIQMINAQ